MEANEETIRLFTTRIRQMIYQYKELKLKIDALDEMLSERNNRIYDLEKQLNQAKIDYNSLKMAKMIEISDGEVQNSQKVLSKLIREVNKCITLLSSE